ncbi:MAG: hypothetical protein QOH69_1252 [Actinomycetota bacterium]|jgi:hypothetical protein|nr:hypothetical protein [Actinomycetota bacterium]
MKTISTNMSVADFCQALGRNEILVNREYQRSDKVWPVNAKSFLIETILLDYPIPKLWLHQNLDLVTRETRKDIVDGQQRSAAVLDFYQNRLRLSRTLTLTDAAGHTFDELSPELQTQFLDYGLNFDLFLGTQPEEVREVFRRMNSFTVPLNPEESRHASFQGPFKWFVLELARTYDDSFRATGIFTEKQIIRMSDAKLITEISFALENGIKTTTKAMLDRIYKANDVVFGNETAIDSAIRRGFDEYFSHPEFRDTPLTKPYNVLPLVLAYIVRAGAAALPSTYAARRSLEFEAGNEQFNLALLADVLETGVGPEDLEPFEIAARTKTNTADQRRTRFEFFLGALGA